ncbi:MAG: tetratricopeptide repeat protein [Gallionella sp.]|nr:tetratricopeptide repeat protein [Gallionella sp.]
MKFVRLTCWLFSGLMLAASGAYAQNSITALTVGDIANGMTIVKVELAQPLANLPAGFTTDTPPRIVLDFPDTANGLGKSIQDFTEGGLRSANIVQAGGRTRLVINLDRMLVYNTKIDGNSLSISLQSNAVDTKASSNTLRLAEANQGVQKLPAKAGQEVPKPAAAETQAKSPAALLPQSGSAPASESMGILLREADALLKGGKPADAYNLLEPKEADYSGEIAFDYLLGIAALDSGKPDRATIAFERVLAVNPNFAGARLDLARAYFAMGSDDLAKNEFETVLAQNPPEPTAAVIKKHLEVIAERQLAKIQQVTAYLEMSMGHDDNITAATPDFTGGVLGAFSIPGAIATGSAVHYSGMYTGVSGGVDFNRLVSQENGVSLFAGADVKQRVYNDVAPMNNLSLDLRAGVAIANGDNSYRVTGTFGQYRQSGFIEGTNNFRDTAGLSAEWKHSFGARDQMTWSLSFSQPRYLTTPTQDTNQVALSTSWLHIFEGETTPLIFANLNRSIDKALQPLTGKTADMSRTGTGVLVHFQFTPLADTDFFLSGGLTTRHDDSPNARSTLAYDFYARDETQSVSFGVITRPWKKWTIKGSAALTNNRSNLSLYQYRRNDSSVSLRRDF